MCIDGLAVWVSEQSYVVRSFAESMVSVDADADVVNIVVVAVDLVAANAVVVAVAEFAEFDIDHKMQRSFVLLRRLDIPHILVLFLGLGS